MTPQELKNSILQLAIQGKLVEQRPEEGTGEELYRQIQVEKQRLVKTSKIKKEKPLPEISDDEKPFDIPESWEWVRLGECCEMYTGNSISEGEKRAKYEGRKEGLDYIGTKDVSFRQTICYNNGVKIPFDKEIDFRKARAGAILLCIEGGSAGKKIAILDRDVCFGNKLCMFMPRTLLNTYLFFFLQSMEFRKVFSENMTGIIGGVSIKKLKEIVLSLPPLAEQKRIVAKIEELMPLVERYEKAWSKLKDFNKRFPVDMQKSLLQMAIQGKLVEQRAEEGTGAELLEKILAAKNAKKNLTQKRRGAEATKESRFASNVSRPVEDAPFDIPESWEWVRLGDVSNKITDGEHKTPRRVSEYCGYYLLSARNIRDGSILLSDVDYVDQEEFETISKRCNPKRGDVLVSCSGSVGRCTVVNDGNNYVMVRSAAMISPVGVDSAYMMFAVQSECVQEQIRDKTKQTAQANLFQAAIRSLIIPLPPLAEQKRIVAKLEELLPLCEQLK